MESTSLLSRAWTYGFQLAIKFVCAAFPHIRCHLISTDLIKQAGNLIDQAENFID